MPHRWRKSGTPQLADKRTASRRVDAENRRLCNPNLLRCDRNQLTRQLFLLFCSWPSLLEWRALGTSLHLCFSHYSGLFVHYGVRLNYTVCTPLCVFSILREILCVCIVGWKFRLGSVLPLRVCHLKAKYYCVRWVNITPWLCVQNGASLSSLYSSSVCLNYLPKSKNIGHRALFPRVRQALGSYEAR